MNAAVERGARKLRESEAGRSSAEAELELLRRANGDMVAKMRDLEIESERAIRGAESRVESSERRARRAGQEVLAVKGRARVAE